MSGVIATLYLVNDANPAWLTYSTQNKNWVGAAVPVSTMSTPFESLQGNFEVTEKESGGYWDQKGNWIVSKEKVTGKVIVGLDALTTDDIFSGWQVTGNQCLALVDVDNDQGEYIQGVDFNFTQVGKIGELITSEMSFEFDQATKIAEANTRLRLFTITSYA